MFGFIKRIVQSIKGLIFGKEILPYIPHCIITNDSGQRRIDFSVRSYPTMKDLEEARESAAAARRERKYARVPLMHGVLGSAM